MNAREFFETVRRMREKQKLYFRTRSTQALQESKELERMVDSEIKRVDAAIQAKANPELFGQEQWKQKE